MSLRNHNLADRLLHTLLGLFLLFAAISGQAIERVTFYHNDALDSPVAATDANGTLLWRESYAPYGKRLTREAGSKDTVWYTGKPEDAGLIYFGARWYDPDIGRFMAMDPAGFDPENIHSFGRYAYANDNPYAYVDPDGRENARPGQFFGIGGSGPGGGGFTGGARGAVGNLFGGVPRSGPGATGVNATKSAGGAANSAQGALLKEHLRQAEKYGKGGIKELGNGRTRYYGETVPANKAGEMAGRRTVREWDPATGNKRTWHETLDHSGNVRQVRPELNNGSKTHYTFDKNGNYSGSW